MRTPYSIPVFALVLWCAACASSAPRGAQDASSEDVAEDALESDTTVDTTDTLESDADAAGAVDAEDDAGTTPDVSGSDAADAAMVDAADDIEEPEVLDCEVVGTECEPFSVACEGGDVVFCSRCGFELRREACAEDEVCEEIDGAGRCRPCEGEECPVTVECEEGERACLDFDTRAVCGADGRFEAAADCPAGRRCLDGSCRAQGADTGAACADGAATCAGELCVCDRDSDDPACDAFPAGYCSTRACDLNYCDTRDEVCADFSRIPAFDEGAFCVRSEACRTRGERCGDGLVCNELPTRVGEDPVAWAWACWAPLATIGEPCARDGDCLGGRCRSQDVGGTEVSYCTGGCGADGGCPSHAECVQDPRDDGDYLCLARGNNVDCPRMETEPLRVAATAPLRRFGGGSASVCYFAR